MIIYFFVVSERFMAERFDLTTDNRVVWRLVWVASRHETGLMYKFPQRFWAKIYRRLVVIRCPVVVILFSKLMTTIFGDFDPEQVFLDNENI